jgi:predicted ABC-type ATPase
MTFVAGPPGGGKSSALSIKQLGIDCFNADDRAAELNAGSYRKISPAIRQTVGQELERFILSHIDGRRDLAFETTLRSAITFEQTKLAHANGFRITMVYVAAGPVEEHVRRVANRADLGQHSASEAKIRDIYGNSMRNLVTAFHENRAHRIEFLQIFDTPVCGSLRGLFSKCAAGKSAISTRAFRNGWRSRSKDLSSILRLSAKSLARKGASTVVPNSIEGLTTWYARPCARAVRGTSFLVPCQRQIEMS